MSVAQAAVRSDLAPPFIPHARLFTERVLIDQGSYFAPELVEVDAPVLELAFDYSGALVPAADPQPRVFAASAEGMRSVERDLVAESRARYVLESFGAVEISCADHVEVPPGSRASYLVQLEDNVHAVCAFSAYAVPQLRALGWQVEVAPAYRWQVVDVAVPWYADVAEEQDGDWFSLELGVEIDGRRINLLPTLLDLLRNSKSLSGLLARKRRCIALPLDENRYLPVPPERLQILAEVLWELYEGAGHERLCFPAIKAPSLARLDQVFGEGAGQRARRLHWSGPRALCDRGGAIIAVPKAISVPAGLKATLRPYQQEGLSWLQHLRGQEVGGILADDMGLGKTLQTIAHLLAEHTSGRAQAPSLVVAPTSVIGNWQRELARFAPGLWVSVHYGKNRHDNKRLQAQCDVVLTTYPLVVRDLEQLSQQPWHLLVLDEAQTIKNNRSQTHRAVRSLEAKHRLCLTGTPLENHLGELWSLFSFLMPGYLGDASNFREVYRQPIEAGGDEPRLQALRHRVAPFILRRTKDQVASELPQKTEIVRAVELHGDQRELYESIRIAAHARVRHTIAELGMARSTVAILDALMKLRQVCCDPRLVRVDAARRVQRSAKFELLFELLPRQLEQGRRILLFSQFTSMLKLISEGLHQRGLRHLMLTGATSDRQQTIDAFNGGFADVFLISLKAGGTGLNLTRADTVIHYDPWWNPAAQAQATDRAHRIGQTRPVFVYNLIAAGSVEERMLKLQQRKRDLAQSLLAPAGSTTLSPSEIDSLFEPLADVPA